MTWSYNEALVATKDQVRMLIGDVDETDQQLSDEAIGFFVTGSDGSVYNAASNAALALAARYGRQASSKSVGSMSLSYQRWEHYTQLADTLQAQAFNPGMVLAAPYVGGISLADKATQESDTDRVTPTFTRLGFDPAELTEDRTVRSTLWG